MSLRPNFDQRATESIRGNGIDEYPVERKIIFEDLDKILYNI